jgi:dTDP-4-amino-4,6-dideoxygalactose transaminase
LSEIVAAVMLEQLRAYPKHLSSIIENVSLFKDKIKHFFGIGVVQENNVEPSYTQVIAKIDKDVFKVSKQDFIKKLSNNGFMVGHASFEPINYLSFFKNNYWRKWAISRDVERVRENYLRNFVGAINNYENIGIGFYKTNFLTRSSTIKLIKEIENLLK